MRIFNARLRISDLSNERTQEIDALVDTGSTYSVLPASLLEEIGIVPTGAITFKLADGRTIDMRRGEARAAIDGRNVATLVAFGLDDAEPLLGAYTLEGLRLIVDPVNQKLVPAGPARF